MRKTRKIHTKVAGVTKKNEDNESIQDILEDLAGEDASNLPLELEHEFKSLLPRQNRNSLFSKGCGFFLGPQRFE